MPETKAGDGDTPLPVSAQGLEPSPKPDAAVEAKGVIGWRPTLYVVASKTPVNRLMLAEGLGTTFIIDCEQFVGGKRKRSRDQAFQGLRQLLLRRLLVQHENAVICARSLKYMRPVFCDSLAHYANIETVLCRRQAL